MYRIENRLKRIEEILTPKKKTVITISYKTTEPKSWFELESENFEIPFGVNPKEFINAKIELLRLSGIICCVVYNTNPLD